MLTTPLEAHIPARKGRVFTHGVIASLQCSERTTAVDGYPRGWTTDSIPLSFPKISQFSHSVMSDSLRPHGCQASLSITNSQNLLKLMSIKLVMPSNHLIFCYLLLPCLQPFPASGSFPVSQFFTSGGQNIGVSASASILPKNIKDWFPLGCTGLITLQSKGLSGVFSNTTVQKH